MHNSQQPFMGGFSDHNERMVPPIETEVSLVDSLAGQTRLTSLLESGFTWEEAIRLLNMQEYLYENSEMRQRLSDNYRIHFVRWLIEHGELSE
jgi:hypothetical protein